MVLSGVDGDGDLHTALSEALRLANSDNSRPVALQLAASVRRAYERGLPGVAEEIGASLVALTACDLEPEQLLGRVIGAVERCFGGKGSSSTRLASLLQGMCIGYVVALQERLAPGQLELPPEPNTGQALVAKSSTHDAELLHAAFAQAGIGIGISDITGKILAVNTAFAAMFGYADVEEFLATFNVTDLNHPDDPPEVWDLYGKLMRGEVDRVSIDKPHLHRDGRTLWTNINVSLIRSSDGAPAYTLALFEDMTERHQLEEQMRHEVLHDPLTGLPNRSQLFNRLTEEFKDRHSRVGICYVDLDRFKAINDALGHDVGDKLLVEVANRLRSCLRRPNQFVARVGGDEFIIVVSQPRGISELAQVADSVLHALASPIDIDGHPLKVSASVGVMHEQVANASIDELMKRADASLGWAKEAGRNRWELYDPEREDTRYRLSAAMRTALEHGEFFLEYQPIVRLSDNHIIGGEALLRWAHPTLGTLLPDRFIDLAEDNGLIAPLTAYVIEQACREARDWRNDNIGQQPFVSVNVSASNIHDPNFLPLLERVLVETGMPSHALQFELTETRELTTAEGLVLRLQELSTLGITIAIDDFGTGFSSLAYLLKLPIHVVKLAAPFIKNLGSNLHGRLADEQIVRAIIHLAHTLGLTITAEQVEDPGQAARLRTLGCDSAQGWLFARPLPPNEFRAALQNSSLSSQPVDRHAAGSAEQWWT